jgi:hypothetical protein
MNVAPSMHSASQVLASTTHAHVRHPASVDATANPDAAGTAVHADRPCCETCASICASGCGNAATIQRSTFVTDAATGNEASTSIDVLHRNPAPPAHFRPPILIR